MSTKDKILELFELNKGIFFSGEDIAHRLSISRAAVWKAVKSLQNEGYQIEAVNNKGYSLSEDTDIISCQGIRKYLNENLKDTKIEVLPKINSTNSYLKNMPHETLDDGYTVIALEQTEGLGRKGRTFFSPKDTGIYISLFLKPKNYSAQKAVRITTMAAVAMCETIKEVSNKNPMIKWVNDIFIDNKKVCGILTQASFDLESSTIEYIILGVGLNLYNPQGGFPSDIQNIAGSIFEDRQQDMKNRISALFINNFMKIYRNSKNNDYIEKYKEYSLVIGQKISVVTCEKTRDAFALSIDDECRLLVRYDDGTQEYLSSGEISIKI